MSHPVLIESIYDSLQAPPSEKSSPLRDEIPDLEKPLALDAEPVSDPSATLTCLCVGDLLLYSFVILSGAEGRDHESR